MVRRNCCVLAGTIVVVVSVCTFACIAGHDESPWQTNFEAAKTKARNENKLLLVDFTGSDWCTWCVQLKDEVFDQAVFQEQARQKFVLVELDFPRQKQLPEELKAQNEQLALRYQVDSFPTILILDAEGQRIARTSYRPGGPEEFVQHLMEFVNAHEMIVRTRAVLATVQGLDRAKLLDQLIEAYEKLGTDIADIRTWTGEIVTLDAENKAGLRVKYQFRQLVARAFDLQNSRKFDEAKAVYAQALAMPGISDTWKQNAYIAQGECCFRLKDFVGVVACLKKAIEVAPDNPHVTEIQGMIQGFSPMAETQGAVAKFEGQLEQAQGLDRAKLLDQMIGARTQLEQWIPDENLPQEVEKWSREIVALDAENKAGLKGTYEVRRRLVEAQNLRQTQKFDEAQARST